MKIQKEQRKFYDIYILIFFEIDFWIKISSKLYIYIKFGIYVRHQMMQYRYRICDAVSIFIRYISLLSLEYIYGEGREKKKKVKIFIHSFNEKFNLFEKM